MGVVISFFFPDFSQKPLSGKWDIITVILIIIALITHYLFLNSKNKNDKDET